jgi:hypothetical protein
LQAVNLDRALSIEHLFKENSVNIMGSDLIKSMTKEITILESKPSSKIIERQIDVFKKVIDGVDPETKIIIPRTAYEKLNIHG